MFINVPAAVKWKHQLCVWSSASDSQSVGVQQVLVLDMYLHDTVVSLQQQLVTVFT